jgi:hypothetical protein
VHIWIIALPRRALKVFDAGGLAYMPSAYIWLIILKRGILSGVS